jgi:transposase InsO family protein
MEAAGPPTAEERVEIRELKRELERARRERDILGKAVAYFSVHAVCWDNTVAKSFFGTLQRELAHRRRRTTRAEAPRDLIRWIEGWFNTRRMHSSIDYNTSVEHEEPFYRHGDGIAA